MLACARVLWQWHVRLMFFACFQCTPCNPGTWSGLAIGSSDNCTLCGAGSYSTTAGGSKSSVCTSCWGGSYSTGSGQSKVCMISKSRFCRRLAGDGRVFEGLGWGWARFSLPRAPPPSVLAVGWLGEFIRGFGLVWACVGPVLGLCWAGICQQEARRIECWGWTLIGRGRAGFAWVRLVYSC
jgi:hypothetical protein